MLYPNELRAHEREKMVGVERFELPTSCSQSRRATRLRYTPRPGLAQCEEGEIIRSNGLLVNAFKAIFPLQSR